MKNSSLLFSFVEQLESAISFNAPQTVSSVLTPSPFGRGLGRGLEYRAAQLRPSSPTLLPEGEGRYQIANQCCPFRVPNGLIVKTKNRRQRMFGSGSLKVSVVCFLLLLLRSGVSNHNHQRAALVPMMVGTVVRMVVMTSSAEAHSLFGLLTKQVDLYLTGDLRVNGSLCQWLVIEHGSR
jgi:hypothetical protein